MDLNQEPKQNFPALDCFSTKSEVAEPCTLSTTLSSLESEFKDNLGQLRDNLSLKKKSKRESGDKVQG